MPLHFTLTTPERTVFEDTVDSLTLPTRMGEITVLPNHIPLVAALVPGEVILRKDRTESLLAVSSGFIEVKPGNEITVLADTAERAEEIDVKRAEEAKERARKLLEQKEKLNEEAFASAAAALERELARLRVARKRHRSHGPVILAKETEQE